MTNLVPIILAGGSGKRLWPISTHQFPKQFHALLNQQSLLQATINRLSAFSDIEEPLIITQEKHRFVLAEQLQTLNKKARILLENSPHNTGVATTLAALYASSLYTDPILLISPSDLHINDAPRFAALIEAAVPIAEQGKLVVFGVHPTAPLTHYGYIKKGKRFTYTNIYTVESFAEKPSEEIAKKYIETGSYLWNSGIFLLKASALFQELNQFAPDILQTCQHAMAHVIQERDFVHFDQIPETCSHLPLDKAVFEKTQHAVVIPFAGEWHDLGNWEALYEISDKDEAGNVKHGQVLSLETKNSYLYSTQPILVTCGMQNCCIIVTKDAVLVSDMTQKFDLEKDLAVLFPD